MDAFYTAAGITFGILAPIIAVAFIVIIASAAASVAKTAGPAMQIKADQLKKQPPFDDVEVNVNPATRVMSIRFYKNDTVIWAGSATQNANDDKLEFTSEDIK